MQLRGRFDVLNVCGELAGLGSWAWCSWFGAGQAFDRLGLKVELEAVCWLLLNMLAGCEFVFVIGLGRMQTCLV